MREFSKGEIRKMRELKKKNFSNNEISRVLHVGHKRVNKFLGDEKSVKKVVGDKKEVDEKGGNNDTRTDGSETGRVDPEYQSEDSSSLGGKQIDFIGGSDMGKTEEGAPEKIYYKCYNCDFQSETPFEKCPKCDKQNDFA